MINVVRFSDAYAVCEKKFLEEGYPGVGTIFQTDEAWVFTPKIDEVEYGTLPIVFPRNGDEPFYFDWTLESKKRYLDSAVIIE